MIKILKYIIKRLTNILNSFINNLKKIENFLTDDKLTLIRISKNTLGRNINFILSNDKLLEKKNLFYQIYMFLMNNQDFLDFGEYKIIIVNGKIRNDIFNLHHNVLIKNNTSFYDYWNKIENILEHIYEEGYGVEGIPMIEINVWNMDLYANKKIKITKNALNESELTLTNKKLFQKNGFSLNNLKNRRFYSTSKNKEDKYLSYKTNC